MRSIDLIKNSLIDKILTIENQDFLVAFEKLIDSSSTANKVELT